MRLKTSCNGHDPIYIYILYPKRKRYPRTSQATDKTGTPRRKKRKKKFLEAWLLTQTVNKMVQIIQTQRRAVVRTGTICTINQCSPRNNTPKTIPSKTKQNNPTQGRKIIRLKQNPPHKQDNSPIVSQTRGCVGSDRLLSRTIVCRINYQGNNTASASQGETH